MNLTYVRSTHIKRFVVRLTVLLLCTFCPVGISQADYLYRPRDSDFYGLALSPDRTLIAGIFAPLDAGAYLRLFDTEPTHAKPHPAWLTSSIASVAFSPDGRSIAAACDNTVHLWSVAARKRKRIFAGGGMAIAFSADGLTLASSSGQTTITLWEVKSGKVIATLPLPKTSVYCLAFSPDGTRLAAGTRHGNCAIWDLPSHTVVTSFHAHTKAILALTFSPDGSRLATASQDATCKIWNGITGQELFTLRGHTQVVCSLAFSPSGDRILTGSHDKTVRLWNAESGQELQVKEGFANIIYVVAFTPDGNTLLAVDGTSLIKLPMETKLLK